MEKYSEYKDSGVQWLGEIPSHWKSAPLNKAISEIRTGLNPRIHFMLNTDDADGYYITIRELRGFDIITDMATDRINTQAVIRINERARLKVGDVLISGTATIGRTALVSEYPTNWGIKEGIYAITPKNSVVGSRYLIYYLNSNAAKGIMDAVATGSTVRSVSMAKFYQMPLSLPPLPEQQAIVAFLDDKYAKLDRLVANKEKEIELLREMKQRVIADAVTRGLDPDVKFKPTGIPWLPQIPEHWGWAKLKAFCKDNKEKNKDGAESRVLSLSYGNVIIKQNVNFGLVPDNYNNYQIVNPGYIILRLTDLQNDHKSLRTGLVRDRGIITSAYVGLIVQNMDSQYTQLLLHSFDVMKVFYGMGGGLRQSMSYQDISNLYIPVPPLEEQKSIVSYITSRIEKIDSLTSKLQQEIDNIKEYKQRLISDVVTGQIKVC